MLDRIRTEKQYKEVMLLIENFISRATAAGGFHALSVQENKELKQLSLLAERYENEVQQIMPLPVSVPALVRQKAQELNLTQSRLSELMGIEPAKLSLILNGRRKPDISFLKAAHQKLGLDGNLMLTYL